MPERLLRYFLEMRGVRVVGRDIKHEQVPPSARKFAELESLPLHENRATHEQVFDNFIAEALVKTLGKEIKGAPGHHPKKASNHSRRSYALGSEHFGLQDGVGLGLDSGQQP